jgi:predicted metal-dependent hydrolase
MTPEARLDRLERIAKLFVRAGVRYRRDLRELGDKLNIMVNMQMQNDERFVRNEAIFQSRSAEYEKRFNRNEERLSKLAEKTDQKFGKLAESQARTDRNLAELIKIVRRGRNGNPPASS